MAERRASEVALTAMGALHFEFGGQIIYFPSGNTKAPIEERAEAIYRKFMDGSSIIDLAREYGHSVQWVYHLIAMARKAHRAQTRSLRHGARS